MYIACWSTHFKLKKKQLGKKTKRKKTQSCEYSEINLRRNKNDFIKNYLKQHQNMNGLLNTL